MFEAILRISIVAGVIVYVPSLYLSVHSGLMILAVVDSLAMLCVVGLYILRETNFTARTAAFCFTAYVLGVTMLVTIGAIAQVYLIGFSILTTLLLGLRFGLASVALNAGTIVLAGAMGGIGADGAMVNAHAAAAWSALPFGDLPVWVLFALNFLLTDLLLSVAVGAVLSHIERLLEREVAAHTTLGNERRLLRTLVDALPDVVFTKDTSARFVICNPPTVALLGARDEADLAGKTVFELFPREMAGPYHQDDLAVLAGKPVHDRLERTFDSEGNARWFQTIKVPQYDGTGTVIGIIGVSRDVTARKRADEALQHSLLHLRTVIDTSPECVKLLSPAGCPVEINAAGLEMLEANAADQVIGQPPERFIAPEDRERFARFVRSVCAGEGGTLSYDIVGLRGGRRTVETIAAPLRMPDGATVFLGISRDVTDRLRLEEQLRQAQKIQAIGQLTGGIAHDFNNLLTVILGNAESLVDNLADDPPNRALAEITYTAALRGADLTHSLLAFARRQALQPRAVDVNGLLDAMHALLQRTLGEHIDIRFVPEAGLCPAVIDPTQLESALLNLAVNARDAMPDGGRLTIETAHARLDTDYVAQNHGVVVGEYVMVAVSDTGTGMSPEVMVRAFEPFFTTKEVGKGSGLGLSMVYGFVKQSGGHVKLYSELGEGTSVKVFLPAAPQRADTRATKGREDAPPGTGEAILVVEDDSLVRQHVAAVLRRLGYSVTTAPHAAAALDLLREGKICDLLLTDVVMPGGMNGPALAREALALRPGLRVLFTSGYTENAITHDGRLDPGIVLLSKPYRKDEIATKVRMVLDGAPAAV